MKALTITGVICAGGGAIAAALLALPPADSTRASAPVATAARATAPAPAATTPRSTAPAPPAAVKPPVPIDISGFKFSSGNVEAGGRVVVTNRDSSPHALTSSDGLFDTGALNQNKQATLTAPTRAGTYRFFCAIHPSMTGTLAVA